MSVSGFQNGMRPFCFAEATVLTFLQVWYTRKGVRIRGAVVASIAHEEIAGAHGYFEVTNADFAKNYTMM